MADYSIDTKSMTSKAISLVVAIVVFACVLIPVLNAMENGNSGGGSGDESEAINIKDMSDAMAERLISLRDESAEQGRKLYNNALVEGDGTEIYTSIYKPASEGSPYQYVSEWLASIPAENGEINQYIDESGNPSSTDFVTEDGRFGYSGYYNWAVDSTDWNIGTITFKNPYDWDGDYSSIEISSASYSYAVFIVPEQDIAEMKSIIDPSQSVSNEQLMNDRLTDWVDFEYNGDTYYAFYMGHNGARWYFPSTLHFPGSDGGSDPGNESSGMVKTMISIIPVFVALGLILAIVSMFYNPNRMD